MRIACPNCAAEYEVPDRLLSGTARMLRCSRCAAEFPLSALPEPEPSPAPMLPLEEVPILSPAPAPEPRVQEPLLPPFQEHLEVAMTEGSSRMLVGAWAISLALVAGGVAAAVIYRAEVMAAWPPATKIFSALGLA